MKGFIFSLCIIIVIFALVIANSLYTLNVTETLIDKINFLTPESDTLMHEIRTLWDKNSFILGLSSSTKETDRIEDMLSTLEVMYRSNTFSGLEEKKALLTNYIRLINMHERLNIENLI